MLSGSIPRLRVGPTCQDRRFFSRWPAVWLTLWLAAAALAPAWAGVAQLTTNGQSGQYPQINNRGQVAWAGYDGAHRFIDFWDGATARTLMQLQTQFPYVQLNDAGQVVWADSTGVFLWDGSVVRPIRSTSIAANPQAAVINNAGQVAWVEAGQVYLWNGFSTQALGGSGGLVHLNNQGQVVWTARDSLNQQIFFWNGASLRQLTNTPSANDYPQLNDAGQVVW